MCRLFFPVMISFKIQCSWRHEWACFLATEKNAWRRFRFQDFRLRKRDIPRSSWCTESKESILTSSSLCSGNFHEFSTSRRSPSFCLRSGFDKLSMLVREQLKQKLIEIEARWFKETSKTPIEYSLEKLGVNDRIIFPKKSDWKT
jgi:hypothetical protein